MRKKEKSSSTKSFVCPISQLSFWKQKSSFDFQEIWGCDIESLNEKISVKRNFFVKKTLCWKVLG